MTKKILIIEDDPSIANLQKDYLEINNMNAVIENDGKAGLDRALADSFDLIIIDIMLPSMEGFDICKQIRQHKQTPIIIISAKKEDIDKIRGLGLGADDYMIKPFSPSEMVARVQAHIKRHETLTLGNDEKQPLIEIGNLRIDKRAHKIFISEEEVIFTTKEFNLLLFLAEHPNRVWSKEQLFEQVWGMDVLDSDVSTVVVHIKRIREKVKDKQFDNFPIETIWGSGYRFNK